MIRNPLRNPWIVLVALAGLFVAAYWIPLRTMVQTWMTNDDYSYGFLIPVVSAYLFWDMRGRRKTLRVENSWAVLPLVVLFILVSVYGILGSSGNVSMPAIPVLIVLFIAFCFGVKTLKRFILPIGFLVFMVPLPGFLDRTIGVFLKSVSSQVGGMIIRWSGLSVHVSGNVIDLGVTQLQVVDACSGLRFVFPLLALGVVYAHFFEKTRWKQVVCVAATIPIAILTNALRIGITGILTHYFGTEVAQGFFHDFSGWVIFMVAFAFLFLLGRLLRLIPSRGIGREASRVAPADSPSSPPARWTRGNRASVVSAALLAAVSVLTFHTSVLPPFQIKGGFQGFPLSIDAWQGRAGAIDAEIIDLSGAEDAFSATYTNDRGEAVNLYVGYRGSAYLENENYFHSPTVCLPASGWKTTEVSTWTIPDVPEFNRIKTTRMIIENMGEKQLVYFWFQTKDKATHDKNINRFHLAMSAIQGRNTHVLFLRLITPFGDSDRLDAAQERLAGFTRSLMPALVSFLEQNQEPVS